MSLFSLSNNLTFEKDLLPTSGILKHGFQSARSPCFQVIHACHTRGGMSVSEFLLAEMLWEHSNWCKDKNSCCSSVFDKLAGAVNEEKEYLIASSYDGQHTLGFTFELYHAYCTQAKEMLYRRLDKLQTLFSCTATLDKAKPEKKAAAQVAKDEADKAFKAISETAKREIEEYTVQYASAFRENLISFTQAQIHHSKQTYNHLSRLRDELLRVEMTETAAD